MAEYKTAIGTSNLSQMIVFMLQPVHCAQKKLLLMMWVNEQEFYIQHNKQQIV